MFSFQPLSIDPFIPKTSLVDVSGRSDKKGLFKTNLVFAKLARLFGDFAHGLAIYVVALLYARAFFCPWLVQCYV
jgi:hypothetical protein